jgi:hypothetical protein
MRKTRRNPKPTGENDSPGYRSDVVEILSRLLLSRPDIVPGKMFGFPAFYTAGKMFACVYGDGVGLKLPQDTARQLKGKPGITPFQPYGKRKLREWIHLRRTRASGFSKDARLFEESIAFVAKAVVDNRKPERGKRLPGAPLR